MDKIIKKAFADAEKEQQEVEVSRIKGIVKDYLVKIKDKNEKKDKLDKEIKILKKDLDDLKAGRLDKIEERQQADEEARNISIIIVERVREHYTPAYPWSCPYTIRYNTAPLNWSSTTGTQLGSLGGSFTTTTGGYVTTTAGVSALSVNPATTASFTLVGTSAQNFVGGTYNVGGSIINL